MKPKHVLFPLLYTVIIYIISVYVAADFDIRNWDPFVRFISAFLMIVGIVTGVMVASISDKVNMAKTKEIVSGIQVLAVDQVPGVCKGCIFENGHYLECRDAKCQSTEREDERDVIFIRYPEELEAQQLKLF